MKTRTTPRCNTANGTLGSMYLMEDDKMVMAQNQRTRDDFFDLFATLSCTGETRTFAPGSHFAAPFLARFVELKDVDVCDYGTHVMPLVVSGKLPNDWLAAAMHRAPPVLIKNPAKLTDEFFKNFPKPEALCKELGAPELTATQAFKILDMHVARIHERILVGIKKGIFKYFEGQEDWNGTIFVQHPSLFHEDIPALSANEGRRASGTVLNWKASLPLNYVHGFTKPGAGKPTPAHISATPTFTLQNAAAANGRYRSFVSMDMECARVQPFSVKISRRLGYMDQKALPKREGATNKIMGREKWQQDEHESMMGKLNDLSKEVRMGLINFFYHMGYVAIERDIKPSQIQAVHNEIEALHREEKGAIAEAKLGLITRMPVSAALDSIYGNPDVYIICMMLFNGTYMELNKAGTPPAAWKLSDMTPIKVSTEYSIEEVPLVMVPEPPTFLMANTVVDGAEPTPDDDSEDFC